MNVDQEKKIFTSFGFLEELLNEAFYHDSFVDWLSNEIDESLYIRKAGCYAFADPPALENFNFHRQLLSLLPSSTFWSHSFHCFITEDGAYLMYSKGK